MNTERICKLSDMLYIILILILGIQFIKTNNIVWLIYIAYALGGITIIGYSIRDLISYFGYSDSRPYLKKYSMYDPWSVSGMPSLHALSTFLILSIMSKYTFFSKIYNLYIIGLCVVWIRVFCKAHSILQIVLGALLGSIFGNMIYMLTNTSVISSVSLLIILLTISLHYIISKIQYQYNQIKHTDTQLPKWFDQKLVYGLKKSNRKISIIEFIRRCHLPMIKNRICLPIRLQWNQIECDIHKSLSNDYHPDLIIGFYPNGIYFTKIVAMYYNKPFMYSTVHSIQNIIRNKKQRILFVNDTITPEMIDIKNNNKNIKIFVLSACNGCDYYTYNISFIAYPWT